ncbi:MAG: WG repeat-containing protein [Bacteroidales bacterium]|nr:WG repeat-containing protein [Bacteroidales bacterium]
MERGLILGKKSTVVLFTLTLLLPILAWAQPKSTAPLPPEESKARLQQLGDSLRKYDYFDYLDRHGWIIVCVRSYDNAKKAWPNRFGIIDDYGRQILPCEYSDIRFQEHSDLIFVMKDSLLGFMNRQLEWVIPPKYDGRVWYDVEEVDDFFEYGMIVLTDMDGKEGVVDSTGREILPFQDDWVRIASRDLFIIEKRNEKVVGAVNHHGDTVIPFIYNHLYAYNNRYLKVDKQSLYGMLSVIGQEVVPCKYDEMIWESGMGYFAVRQGGKWGVVDSTNNVVVPFIYDASYFWFFLKSDIILLLIPGKNDDDMNSQVLLNRNGKVLVSSFDEWIPSESGERFAILNYDQDWNATCEIYDRQGRKVDAFEGMEYEEELLPYISMIPVKRNGKWGFVNRNFELIVPCQYETPIFGGDGYGYVNTGDGQTTLIDEQGQLIISGPYAYISSPKVNGWFMVGGYPPDSWKGLSGFIDRYGNSTFTEEEMQKLREWHEKRKK